MVTIVGTSYEASHRRHGPYDVSGGWASERRQTTVSGSNPRPVGPIWISVSISGHTPQS